MTDHCPSFSQAQKEAALAASTGDYTTHRICRENRCPLRAYARCDNPVNPWTIPFLSIFKMLPKVTQWATLPLNSGNVHCNPMNQQISAGLLSLKTTELLSKFNGVDVDEVGKILSQCNLPFIGSIPNFYGLYYPSREIKYLYSLKVDHTISPYEIYDLTLSAISEGATHYCMRTTQGKPYNINLLVDYLACSNQELQYLSLP